MQIRVVKTPKVELTIDVSSVLGYFPVPLIPYVLATQE